MPTTYDDNIPEAPQWQAALEKKLQQEKSNQLQVSYGDVARAFPSQNPHERTFDFDLIDDTTFLPWANSRGWKAIESQETSIGETSFPVILFTRTA
jgi:hypothetical protein